MKRISHSSKKGSVLILVLIFFAILSTLGAMLLGLSTMNYKMKLVSQRHKNAFYLAEAALEETHALIAKQIEVTLNTISPDGINNLQWKQQYRTKLNADLLPLLENHIYTNLETLYSEAAPAVRVLSFQAFNDHQDTCYIVLKSTATFQNVFQEQKIRMEIDVPNNPHHAASMNVENLLRMIYLPIE